MNRWWRDNWPVVALGLIGVLIISGAVVSVEYEQSQRHARSNGRAERCESFCTDKGGMAHISRDPGWGGPVYLCVCRDGTTVPL